MAVGDGDVAAILENGDFNTDAVFTLSVSPTVTLTVQAWFTDGTEGVAMQGVEIEASDPTLMVSTADINVVGSVVKNKMSVTANGSTYTVERIQDTGMGISVVHLKT